MPPFDRSKYSAPYRGPLAWALPGVRVIRFRASRLPALIPVVLVLGIITLSWATTVFGALLPLLSSAPLTALAGLLIFHPIVAAVVANYLLCVATDPGSVPDDWRAPPPTPSGGVGGQVPVQTGGEGPHAHGVAVGCVSSVGVGGDGGIVAVGGEGGVHEALLMEDNRGEGGDAVGGPGTAMTSWERGADRAGSAAGGVGGGGGGGGDAGGGGTAAGATFRYAHLMHERNGDGGYRYCNKCGSYKPDRTHHCRRCGMCVMKMDHDCVFIANCVGAGNHKFFLSFIFWAFLGTLFTTVVAGPAFFRVLTNAGGHVGARRPRHVAAAAHALYDAAAEAVLLRRAAGGSVVGGPDPPQRADLTALLLGGYILNTSFTFALGIFVAMHAYLLSHGRTTIEMYELADAQRLASARAYDLGVRPNVVATCGPSWYLWGVPTTVGLHGGAGGGVVWERRRPAIGV